MIAGTRRSFAASASEAIRCCGGGAALSGAGETAVGNVTRLLPEDVRLIVKDMMLARPEEEKVIGARARIISSAIDLNAKGRIVLKEGA